MLEILDIRFDEKSGLISSMRGRFIQASSSSSLGQKRALCEA